MERTAMTPTQVRDAAAKIARDAADRHRLETLFEDRPVRVAQARTANHIADAIAAMPLPAESPANDGLAKDMARALDQERDNIVTCIRSTTWSGSEEIVAMIRSRRARKGGAT